MGPGTRCLQQWASPVTDAAWLRQQQPPQPSLQFQQHRAEQRQALQGRTMQLTVQGQQQKIVALEGQLAAVQRDQAVQVGLLAIALAHLQQQRQRADAATVARNELQQRVSSLQVSVAASDARVQELEGQLLGQTSILHDLEQCRAQLLAAQQAAEQVALQQQEAVALLAAEAQEAQQRAASAAATNAQLQGQLVSSQQQVVVLALVAQQQGSCVSDAEAQVLKVASVLQQMQQALLLSTSKLQASELELAANQAAMAELAAAGVELWARASPLATDLLLSQGDYQRHMATGGAPFNTGPMVVQQLLVAHADLRAKANSATSRLVVAKWYAVMAAASHQQQLHEAEQRLEAATSSDAASKAAAQQLQHRVTQLEAAATASPSPPASPLQQMPPRNPLRRSSDSSSSKAVVTRASRVARKASAPPAPPQPRNCATTVAFGSTVRSSAAAGRFMSQAQRNVDDLCKPKRKPR